MNDFREYNDYLMHYGRKGQRWGRSIFQDDYDPIGHLAKWGEDAYNAAKDTYQNTVKPAATNAYNAVRDTAYNTRYQLGQLRDDAYNAGRQAATNAYNAAKETYQNTVKPAATNAYNAGRQAASEAYNSAKETASNVGNSIQNRFNKIRRDVNWAKVDFEQFIRKQFIGDLSTPTRQGLHNRPSGWKSLGNNVYEYWLTDIDKRKKRR